MLQSRYKVQQIDISTSKFCSIIRVRAGLHYRHGDGTVLRKLRTTADSLGAQTRIRSHSMRTICLECQCGVLNCYLGNRSQTKVLSTDFFTRRIGIQLEVATAVALLPASTTHPRSFARCCGILSYIRRGCAELYMVVPTRACCVLDYYWST